MRYKITTDKSKARVYKSKDRALRATRYCTTSPQIQWSETRGGYIAYADRYIDNAGNVYQQYIA